METQREILRDTERHRDTEREREGGKERERVYKLLKMYTTRTNDTLLSHSTRPLS